MHSNSAARRGREAGRGRRFCQGQRLANNLTGNQHQYFKGYKEAVKQDLRFNQQPPKKVGDPALAISDQDHEGPEG